MNANSLARLHHKDVSLMPHHYVRPHPLFIGSTGQWLSPGDLLHVLANGILPSEMLCVKIRNVRGSILLFLGFHSLSGNCPKNVGFPEPRWGSVSSQPQNNSAEIKGPSQSELAESWQHRGLPTAVSSAFSVSPGLNSWCRLLGWGNHTVSGFHIVRAPSLGLMNWSN